MSDEKFLLWKLLLTSITWVTISFVTFFTFTQVTFLESSFTVTGVKKIDNYFYFYLSTDLQYFAQVYVWQLRRVGVGVQLSARIQSQS